MKKFELKSPLRGEGRIVRQAGGLHRYGHIIVSVEATQTAFSISWEVLPGQIPEVFKEAVYRGIKAMFRPGAKFGTYSTDGLLVRIIDGRSHETDSNEGSFEIASALALTAAQDSLLAG